MEEEQQLSNKYLEKKAKREAREQELVDRLVIFKKHRKIKKFLNWLAIIVVIALAGWGIFKFINVTPAADPGEVVPIQPADVIKPGEPIIGIYLSNPPVSGWHYADLAATGASDQEISDQIVIHNLERGDIWITYKTPDATPELIAKLKDIVSRYSQRVILTPRAANDSLIALAAWGRLDKFNYFDQDRIIKFIKAYQGQGPEK